MVYLHPQLEKDSIFITSLDLCMVRLINNAHIPWFILVPQKENIEHLWDLTDSNQAQLFQEISFMSNIIKEYYGVDRLNIGALGNMVPQMHWHIIARFKNDYCWPNPIWGNVPAKEYDHTESDIIIQQIKNKVQDNLD